MLNEDFDVGELLGCEYVRATVDMKLDQLKGCYWEKKGEEVGFIEIYGSKIGGNVSISKSRGIKSALIINYIICHRGHRE
ncbi:MAG: hypothetical protein K8R25_03985 [Methanosarcinales archaeon]|nr:hypothetical protein [Methanosarcinales archaeon]